MKFTSKKVIGIPVVLVIWIMLAVVGADGVLLLYHLKARGGMIDRRVDMDFGAIGSALRMYCMNLGELPSQTQGLEALVVRPADLSPEKPWQQLMREVPLDALGASLWVCKK